MDDFILRALVAGAATGIAAAPLGCFIVWRRMAYFGSTIAHSGILGVALGLWLAIDLTLGVLIVSLALSLLLILLQRQRLIPVDTILGILAHAALAAGVIAASLLPGQRFDLMGYLFGDIFAVGARDLAWVLAGSAIVLGALVWLWRPLLAVSVHEELAAAEGVDVERAKTGFILLIAIAVAAAMKIVGVLLIVSLMIMPAAAARPFARTPEGMALLSALIAAACSTAGIALSYWTDTPGGPSVVLVMALASGFALALAMREARA